MNGILAWGLDVIRFLQGFETPWLTGLMKGITFFGSEGFFIVALPVLYWAVDRERGARIVLVFVFSVFVNLWLKDLWGQPRPFELDRALALAKEIGHGLPSGHSQSSMVFWGMAIALFPKPWGLTLAVVMPLLVGLSRVYLGVHFPTDVFAGWGIGLVFVIADRLAADRFDKLLEFLGGRWRFITLAFVAFIMNALHHSDVSMSGAFLGAGVGFVWAKDKADFSVEGSLISRVGRVLFGLALIVAVYLLLKMITPAPDAELYTLARFIRFGFVGFLGAFVAPWSFLKLRLAIPVRSS